jgi:phosphatidyl-myo-inositol dimannoside synthase
MKILYAIGAFGPRYLANEMNRDLVQEFARRGHSCLVYAAVTPEALQGEPVSYSDGPVLVCRQVCDVRGLQRIPAEIGGRLFQHPRFLQLLVGLRRLLASHPDVDVIHAEAAYPMGTIAAIAGIGHRALLVPSIQGGDLIDYPGYGYGRFRSLRPLIRWTFRRSALVRANSQLMAKRARALGCEARKLHEVAVNIADRFFRADPPIDARRRAARGEVWGRHMLPPGAPLVVSTGRLLPLKGFQDLVAASAQLARSRPDLRVIIAGPDFVDSRSGDQRKALREDIARLGVREQVLLLDTLEYETELPVYLAAADFVVAAAHIEGMNKVVPEAGSQGTPAIVTRTTGVASVVEDLDAGLIVEARDISGLAAAMERLIASPRERDRLGQNARRMSERFRASAVAEQLLDLYEETLARG